MRKSPNGWMKCALAGAAAAVLAFATGCSGNITPLSPTQMALTASATTLNTNASVTLTATLTATGAAPIGVVTFYDGTTSLQAIDITGKTSVTFTTSALTLGANSLTAVYGGDQAHAGSTSTAVTVNVYQPTSTTLTASPAIAPLGGAVTLTATVSAAGNPVSGTVNFAFGATSLGSAALVSGSTGYTASIQTSSLPLGSDAVTATFVASGVSLTSTSAPVTVQVVNFTSTTTALSATVNGAALSSPVASGTSVLLTATITPSATKTVLSGTVTFFDNGVNLSTATVTNLQASITSKQFTVTPTNSITAVYSGDATYYTSTSAPLTFKLSSYTGATYTNPLNLTDTVNKTGKVYNCPDPAIIKSQTGNSDTWYAYCTGDAFNSTDTVTTGGAYRQHLISIFSSTDLVNWTYVRDALPALPVWAAANQELQTPAIKLINGIYMLYFSANGSASPNGPAIGYATALTPAGPFVAAATPLVNQSLLFAGGPSVSKLGPEVVTDGSGNLWLTYGGQYGGIVINQLNLTGTALVGASTSIGVDNYFSNPYIVFNNGYFYEFATPQGACCGGAYSTYSVRVGRSTSVTGPYLDAEGNDLNAFSATSGTNGAPGGDTVLVNTGNTIVGPGSNTTFQDESGQYYILYSGVSTSQQYLPNATGYTARQLMMDPLDWVNGWPVVNNGNGDSDQPQPVPASQPNTTNGYAQPGYTRDTPGAAMAAYSQDFNTTTAYGTQFSVIHNANGLTTGLTAACLDPGNGFATIPGATPGFSSTGLTICSNFAESTNVSGTYGMQNLPILAENEPAGNYMVEIKFHSLTPPTSCCSYNYPAQGLMIYSSDSVYLRLDDWSDFDTRQIEFLNQFGVNGNTALTAFAPVGTPHNASYTYLRLAKRINATTGVSTYTSYSSIDGVTYVRGPAWDVNFGTTAKIGIFADNLGEGATFTYLHVTALNP